MAGWLAVLGPQRPRDGVGECSSQEVTEALTEALGLGKERGVPGL